MLRRGESESVYGGEGSVVGECVFASDNERTFSILTDVDAAARVSAPPLGIASGAMIEQSALMMN